MDEILKIESDILKELKLIYDPEIPVNIYDLGLIYDVDVDDDKNVTLKMTLTAPNCPIADDIVNEVHESLTRVSGIKNINVELVFDPPWDKSMMSEEAKLELGFL
jgi:FeS assembly SUF system protein